MKIKLLLAGLLISVLTLTPGKAQAATYQVEPQQLVTLSGAGCTVDFVYGTRVNNIAVAKIRYRSGVCHPNTRVKVRAVSLLTGNTIYGELCYISPALSSPCNEDTGWSVSHAYSAWAVGAQVRLVGENGHVDHTINLP